MLSRQLILRALIVFSTGILFFSKSELANSQSSVTGELILTYQSSLGEQPYCVYIPQTYCATKSFPLVMAIHGAGDDHRKFFKGYNNGVIKKLAEKYEMVVACPKGDSRSGWQGQGEDDFLRVLQEVIKNYNIDSKRIYLLGHSMGGGAALIFAVHYPDRFAAVGVCAPSNPDPDWAPYLRSLPIYIAHGTLDTVVPILSSRIFVAALKKVNPGVEYLEIPGGDHNNYVADQFIPIFDFFNKKALP